ncbi:MAG TPA: NAD-dependent epimerase/dehydratase family protein [Bryobacteraceae bacterium]
MAHALARDLDHVLAHTPGVWEALRGRRIFITGGTGFVGTWLVESFVWANERLNLNARALLLTRNPDRVRVSNAAVQVMKGDIRTFPYPEGEFAFVIHAATEQRHHPGMFELDLQATKYVLEFARTHGTTRLLFTSSGAVYGKQPSDLTHIPEEYAGAPFTVDLNSAYGQAKRASEFLCAMYAQQFGFSAVIARLFAFAGPHLPLDLNFAIGNFIRDVLAGRPVRIAGDGTPYRSYLYAADLAIWLWSLLIRGGSARPYNVGSGDDLTIASLARTVVDNTVPGARIEIARHPMPGEPPSRYVPSVERARTELGLAPLIPLDEAIRRMYRWNRELATVP